MIGRLIALSCVFFFYTLIQSVEKRFHNSGKYQIYFEIEKAIATVINKEYESDKVEQYDFNE